MILIFQGAEKKLTPHLQHPEGAVIWRCWIDVDNNHHFSSQKSSKASSCSTFVQKIIMSEMLFTTRKQGYVQSKVIWIVEKAFKWSLTQFLPILLLSFSALTSLYLHHSLLFFVQLTRNKVQTQGLQPLRFLLSVQQHGGNKRRQVFACVQRKARHYLQRQTDIWETWQKERIPLKMYALHNVLNFLCLTGLHSLVSLVRMIQQTLYEKLCQWLGM